jgi:hypothetical protein
MASCSPGHTREMKRPSTVGILSPGINIMTVRFPGAAVKGRPDRRGLSSQKPSASPYDFCRVPGAVRDLHAPI